VTRQPSSAMNGSNNAADIRTGLVIGIHQKELAFGRQVAAILPPKNIRIVQIDQGLPQQDSFEGKRYYYGVFHREIYLQLHQQLKKKIDLLIDLHTGINEAGRCADIFCCDAHLLGRLKKTVDKCAVSRFRRPQPIRLVEIAAASSQKHATAGCFPVCHTIIPRAVWKSANYSYVGLEIYLQHKGQGQRADWIYGAGLVESIIKAKAWRRSS
jgi:hypothetical protein